MSAYGSLFERLNGDAQRRAGWSREAALADSVAAHLTQMLSTRAGSVQTLPDYGLPDFNDLRLSLHDAGQQARAAIERFIEAYEPRLHQVRVRPLEQASDPLHLALRIDARLDAAGIRQPLSFMARLGGNGQVRVEAQRPSVQE